jgi:hypothetical protein
MVISANRQDLPNPADPNLLLPGDQISLPSVPPAPAPGAGEAASPPG